MNFIKQMERDTMIEQSLPITERSFRLFMGTKLKGVRVSIQASYAHYCNPRKTFADLNVYTSMEFALLDEKEDFVSVTEVLPNFTRLEEIEKYSEGQVYAYVPVDLINDLYNELQEEN